MPEHFHNGDEVVIKGTITRSGDGSRDDIYGSEKKWDVRDHITEGTEVASQTSQGVLSTISSKVGEMGASGLIASVTAVGFQVDAIQDNYVEAVEIASPMVEELVETGTITPPEGSKFEGVEIPKTTSFFGVKVGEGKISEEEKALQDGLRQSITPNGGAQSQQGSAI